jgi:ribonuclease Y
MLITIANLVTAIFAVMLGAILGYLARQTIAKQQAGTIEAKLERLVNNAKQEAKEIILKAKDKSAEILEEIKKEEKERHIQIRNTEQRLERKDQQLEGRNYELEKKFKELQAKVQKIKDIEEEVLKIREEETLKLENISQLSKEDARKEIISAVEKNSKDVILERMKKLEQNGVEELEKRSREIMALAMQRYAATQAAETSSSTVSLPSDELKGRIIGKEGRNIKALEKLTGVEVIVDETPETIIISGFDPIRRQIAKIALEKLIADGRIQPAKIEEAVETAKNEIGKKIQEAGEAACYDAGVVGFDPKLVKILGRLCFRTSYGQNVLLHSLEVAHLAAAMAAELGVDTELARKAGLFHDIGKAVDHQIEGSHVDIGKMILGKFNIPEIVIKTLQSHHGEYPHENLEAILVQAADAISSARPGARKDTLEAYLKRLKELEDLALSFTGVEKAYAIQAGREIRVFVQPESIDDLEMRKMAKNIADRIQEDMNYPGEIKVTAIRETRVVEYAR